MTDRPRLILLQAATEKGWTVSFHSEAGDEAPIVAALSDEFDVLTFLAEKWGLPMPQIQERPEMPDDSKVARLPRLFGRSGK